MIWPVSSAKEGGFWPSKQPPQKCSDLCWREKLQSLPAEPRGRIFGAGLVSISSGCVRGKEKDVHFGADSLENLEAEVRSSLLEASVMGEAG